MLVWQEEEPRSAGREPVEEVLQEVRWRGLSWGYWCILKEVFLRWRLGKVMAVSAFEWLYDMRFEINEFVVSLSFEYFWDEKSSSFDKVSKTVPPFGDY